MMINWKRTSGPIIPGSYSPGVVRWGFTPLYTALPPPPIPILKQAIVAALLAEPNLTAALGCNIFPVVIPQSTSLVNSAAITYKFISSLHATNIAGAAGMQSVRVRFRVSSFTHLDVETIKEIVRNLFQGYSTSLQGLPIVFVTFENEVDGYDEPIPGSDAGTHWKEFDFVFKLRETIPTNT